MSNPAVITLAHVRTKLGNFQVEDNLGESIHLHLGEIRCDLTIEELDELANAAERALDNFIKAEGFKACEFSKEFLLTLSEMELLPKLISVKDEKVKLSELRVDVPQIFGPDKYKPLAESRVIKALNGNPKENERHRERNYYGQTSQQRVEDMLHSIETQGYPANGQMIMLVNGSNKIYDGQHRAACMYYLWGDKEIPVKRLDFSNFKDTNSISLNQYYLYWKSFIAKVLRWIPILLFKIKNRIKIRICNYLYKKDQKKFSDIK